MKLTVEVEVPWTFDVPEVRRRVVHEVMHVLNAHEWPATYPIGSFVVREATPTGRQP